MAFPDFAGASETGHTVIIWHVDAREQWVGQGPDPAKLETVLLKHCTKAMKSGCKVATSFSTGAALLGRMSTGNQFVVYSKISLADARNSMETECQKQAAKCEVLRQFEPPQNSTKSVYEIPKITPELYRRYGVVVWQKPVTMPVRVWIAAGRRSSELAQNDALANCRADTGGECVVAQYGADTKMIVFSEDGQSLAVTQDSDRDKAQLLLKQLCQANKQTCKAQVVVDTKVEETSVHRIKL